MAPKRDFGRAFTFDIPDSMDVDVGDDFFAPEPQVCSVLPLFV
jgi:hypothetical protein